MPDAPEIARSAESVWESLRNRMNSIGTYHLLQVNGQRKFFDPLSDAPPAAEGCEVFIGRLPRDLYEDELVPLFASIGRIHEFRLMMNFSGTNRGFAFVMYKKREFAEKAIAMLDRFEIRPGHFIGVMRSVNNRRLYIGRLPIRMSEASLFDQLTRITEGMETLRLYVTRKMSDKPPRKFAVATFESHRHAAMARRFLILHKNEFFDGKVTVDWASPAIKSSASDLADRENRCPSDFQKRRIAGMDLSAGSLSSVISKSSVGAESDNNLHPKYWLVPPPPINCPCPPSQRDPRITQPLADSFRPNTLTDGNKYFCNGVNDELFFKPVATPLYSLSPLPKQDSALCCPVSSKSIINRPNSGREHYAEENGASMEPRPPEIQRKVVRRKPLYRPGKMAVQNNAFSSHA